MSSDKTSKTSATPIYDAYVAAVAAIPPGTSPSSPAFFIELPENLRELRADAWRMVRGYIDRWDEELDHVSRAMLAHDVTAALLRAHRL